MTRRLSILILLAFASTAGASGVEWKKLAAYSGVAASGNNPYAAFSPTAVWYPSKTLNNVDVAANAFSPTNTPHVSVDTNGWYFDGNFTYEPFLDFGYPAGLEMGTNDYTISAWVRPTLVNTIAGIAGKTVYGAADRWGVYINSSKYPTCILQDGFTSGGAAGSAIETNVWTHVAATFSRPSNAVVYVNGAAVASNSIAAIPGAVTYDGGVTAPFRIGTYNNAAGVPFNSAYSFFGWMDLVAVWNGRALSAAEISALSALGRTP